MKYPAILKRDIQCLSFTASTRKERKDGARYRTSMKERVPAIQQSHGIFLDAISVPQGLIVLGGIWNT
jgi:hypothetical protein